MRAKNSTRPLNLSEVQREFTNKRKKHISGSKNANFLFSEVAKELRQDFLFIEMAFREFFLGNVFAR